MGNIFTWEHLAASTFWFGSIQKLSYCFFFTKRVLLILLLDAGSHWMPRFCARLWDKTDAMDQGLLGCRHSRDQILSSCKDTHTDRKKTSDRCSWPHWLPLLGLMNTCLQSTLHCFCGIGSSDFWKSNRDKKTLKKVCEKNDFLKLLFYWPTVQTKLKLYLKGSTKLTKNIVTPLLIDLINDLIDLHIYKWGGGNKLISANSRSCFGRTERVQFILQTNRCRLKRLLTFQKSWVDREKNLREELHWIGVELDALLPVLGEIS